MGAWRIGDCIQLANDEMTGATEHQTALLLRRLGLDEPHRRPPYGFADRLCVRCIVLLNVCCTAPENPERVSARGS
jgi:hypothetical protein